MILPNPFKFAKAMWHVLLWTLQGKPVIAPVSVQAHRRFECDRCPYRVDDQCSVCTCFIGVKVMLSCEECPKRVWKKL